MENTIVDLIWSRVQESPKKKAFYSLKDRKWISISWIEFWEETLAWATVLQQQGLKKGDHVAIYAATSLEWEKIHVATLLLGGVVVGLEVHAEPLKIETVLIESGSTFLISDDAERINNVSLTWRNQFLNHIFTFNDLRKLASTSYEDENKFSAQVKPNDPATLIYTSGTTGDPKGVLFTHAQLMMGVDHVTNILNQKGARGVCWLPMSNYFQRLMNLCAYKSNADLYFIEDPRSVIDHIKTIKPTFLIGVPRFYEKFYAGILDQINKCSFWQKKLIQFTFQEARKYVYKKGQKSLLLRLLDLMVLRKIRLVLGGEVKFMISGSAPLSKKVNEFFHALGIPVLEAYGTTEGCVPISINRPDDFRIGSVGKPFDICRVKLSEKGEVLAQAPFFMAGYFNEPVNSRLFTMDGFYKTGDFGHFDKDGFLYLSGRRSDLIKTSTGRRIAPVKVEEIYQRSRLIDQVVVVGNGRKCLVGLLTLDEKYKQVESMKIKTMIQRELETLDKHLPRYEQVQKWVLLREGFSPQTGELTLNLKLRRRFIEDKYKNAIDKMYQHVEATHQFQADTQRLLEI